MKRYLLVVLLVLTPLFFGLQTAFSQADTDNRGNAAFGEALPEELMDLDIKDYYIGSEAEPVGLIQTVTGHVVVLHGDTSEAYFAAEGDAIFTQDVFFTLEESRCRIKLSTEDVITMAEDSQIGIDEFVDDRDMEKKESTISMLKGKAMFYVVPLFRYKDTSTSVETPTAVCGVRGTKFGVGVGEDTQTLVYGFEGDVEVYSPVDGTTQTVGEGQNLQLTGAGAGDVRDTSHAMAEQFILDTEAPAPEEQEAGRSDQAVGEQAEAGEEEQGVGEAEESSEEGAAEGEGSAEGEEATEGKESGGGEEGPGGMVPGGGVPLFPVDPYDPTITQNINTIPVEEMEMWEGNTAGEGSYFATIITKLDGTAHNSNSPVKDPIYVSHIPNLFSGGLESHIAYASAHEGEEGFKMKVEEIYLNRDMKVTYFRWGHANNIALGTPRYFQWNDGGCYLDENGHDYLEWGWWQDTGGGVEEGKIGYYATTPPDDEFFAATARIWEVEGDFTHPDAISYLQQHNFSATYSGEAKGVYADSSMSDLRTLTGGFSCHIDFGNAHVSNFKIDVHDGSGGHQVHMSGGSATLGNCGSFDVSGFTGTIDGSPLASSQDTSAAGSCFGKKAQGVAGVWGAHDGGDKWATGEFHGHR